MSPISEIEAIATLDGALSQLEDPVVRDRVLKWAWDKFMSRPMPPTDVQTGTQKLVRTNGSKKKKAKHLGKSKPSFSIVKDLNLNPNGKSSFKDFVQEKLPRDNQEKCIVALYYLRHTLEMDKISVNHIFTCYKALNWKAPDIYNVLTLISSRKGWADTSDMENITITMHGENLIEHDLPRKTKGK